MGKLIAVAALAAVTTASAIGVGISAHYNLGIPINADFRNNYDISKVGFEFDFEIVILPRLIIHTDVGYQRFNNTYVSSYTYTIIPITFGLETPIYFADERLLIKVAGGMSYNHLRMDTGPIVTSNKPGIWAGGHFYYMVTPNIGIGSG